MRLKLDENITPRAAEKLRGLGTHCGILLVRIPDARQNELAEYLVSWFASEECESWSGCYVVATPTKVRVLRPEQ